MTEQRSRFWLWFWIVALCIGGTNRQKRIEALEMRIAALEALEAGWQDAGGSRW